MNLKNIHIAGFIFTVILGTLLHFSYAFFNFSKIAAPFSAINESTFEHLKLLFWPFTFFAVAEYFIYGKKENSFFFVKLLSVLFGLAVIVTFFYTYTGILGFNVLFLDIFSFILGSFASWYLSYALGENNTKKTPFQLLFIVIWIVLIYFFIYFTYNPLNIGLFSVPS